MSDWSAPLWSTSPAHNIAKLVWCFVSHTFLYLHSLRFLGSSCVYIRCLYFYPVSASGNCWFESCFSLLCVTCGLIYVQSNVIIGHVGYSYFKIMFWMSSHARSLSVWCSVTALKIYCTGFIIHFWKMVNFVRNSNKLVTIHAPF